MSANDKQVGGNHYRTANLQHWDICALFDLGYFEGQATKYLFRWKKKGGIQDLKKAVHYIEKLIEIEEAREKEKSRDCVKSPEKKNPVDPERNFRRPYETTPTLSQEGGPVLGQLGNIRYAAPKSNDYFVYEGGYMDRELYTCKKCNAHFETPLYADPSMYHFHPYEERGGGAPGPGYVNQG